MRKKSRLVYSAKKMEMVGICTHILHTHLIATVKLKNDAQGFKVQSCSRIQLAPHARRRAVPKTVSEWVPAVRLTSDEVAKSGRTGITAAYTENMLSRKRTLWTA